MFFLGRDRIVFLLKSFRRPAAHGRAPTEFSKGPNPCAGLIRLKLKRAYEQGGIRLGSVGHGAGLPRTPNRAPLCANMTSDAIAEAPDLELVPSVMSC
jgi:hypothetical protein